MFSRRLPKHLKRCLSTTKAADFDGEMAKIYAKIAHQHRHSKGPWPLILAKVESFKLAAGSTIVDIASGPGEPAATIALNIPTVIVISTDIAPDMNKIAASRAVLIPNMKSMLADVQDLSAFADNSVDTITCCYGFMFPEDKKKAISETYRILKPGGSMVATYWLNLDMILLTRDIMRRVLGTEPPSPPINPMSLSEPGLFDSIAKQAGFVKSIQYVESTYPFDLGSDADLQYKMCTMIVKTKLDEMNAHDIARKAFEDNLARYATKDPSTGAIVIPNNTFIMATLTK